MHATLPLLRLSEFPQINRRTLDTLQVNLTYRCNQSCVHCHVAAGPSRTEEMDSQNINLIIDVLKTGQINTLDLTGGAPELHGSFRRLVQAATDLGIHVIDRCNLTILEEPGQVDLAHFLAQHKVEVIASLPCYSLENVDKQRGKGTFDKSIVALKQLNALGYGIDDSELKLNLVYNPQGPSLPPGQQALEADYKRELKHHFNIEFNQLFTLANMPIQRFGSILISKNQFANYMQLLKDNYTAANLDNVMCRSLISVDWDGYLYDCDFNQQMGLAVATLDNGKSRPHLRDLLTHDITDRPIVVADHCYGCTAGQGSSCGGALND